MQITMWRTLFIISLSIILISLLQQSGARPAKDKSPKNQQKKSSSGDYIKDNSFKDQTRELPTRDNYKNYKSKDEYNIIAQSETKPKISEPIRNKGSYNQIYA